MSTPQASGQATREELNLLFFGRMADNGRLTMQPGGFGDSGPAFPTATTATAAAGNSSSRSGGGGVGGTSAAAPGSRGASIGGGGGADGSRASLGAGGAGSGGAGGGGGEAGGPGEEELGQVMDSMFKRRAPKPAAGEGSCDSCDSCCTKGGNVWGGVLRCVWGYVWADLT